MQNYKKNHYDEWVSGNSMGRHPENPLVDATPAPKPFLQDILMNKKYVLMTVDDNVYTYFDNIQYT